jgi:hypothetical protein
MQGLVKNVISINKFTPFKKQNNAVFNFKKATDWFKADYGIEDQNFEKKFH